MIKLKTLKTENLSTKNKNDIFNLKASEWKNKELNQILWFKKNIKNKDIHNLLYKKNKLIGYNCIRKIKLIVKKKFKKILIFDTLIIDKKFRKLGLSNEIMIKSTKIIKKNKNECYLVCLKKHVSYYEKFNWKKIKDKDIQSNFDKKKLLMQFKK